MTSTTRPLLSCVPIALFRVGRNAHTQSIDQNMIYISNDKVKLKADPRTLKLNHNIDRPVCIMMNWLLCKPNHLQKYAKLYLDQGFDVISVSCSPWQLLWPTKGSQVIAERLLRFMEVNSPDQLALHGFSVGAYVWAELLVHSLKNEERYQPVLDRIASQVWDSPADVYEAPVGLARALFPHNKLLQDILKSYIIAHMKVFYNIATKHYVKATKIFTNTPCKAPGLFLVSKVDPVGTEERSRGVHETWLKWGRQSTIKCWDNSPHVLHYIYHREEYTQMLYTHLEQCGLLTNNRR